MSRSGGTQCSRFHEIRAHALQLDDLRLGAPLRRIVALLRAALTRRLRRQDDLVGGAVLAAAVGLRRVAAAHHGRAAQRGRRDRRERPQPAGSGAWCLDFHSAYGIP